MNEVKSYKKVRQSINFVSGKRNMITDNKNNIHSQDVQMLTFLT
jgi:hypothetical protein